jgi:sRNA-binding carbon storage regulator CsrA
MGYLVLGRKIGQEVSINDNVYVRLISIDGKSAEIGIRSDEPFNGIFAEFPGGIDIADYRSGVEIVMNVEDDFIINKYFKVKLMGIRGQKVANLGFKCPKNIDIVRMEIYDSEIEEAGPADPDPVEPNLDDAIDGIDGPLPIM